MGKITVTTTDGDTRGYDNADLQASYSAAFTDAGGIVISVDLFRGTELLATVPIETLSPSEAEGFTQS